MDHTFTVSIDVNGMWQLLSEDSDIHCRVVATVEDTETIGGVVEGVKELSLEYGVPISVDLRSQITVDF